MLSADQLKSIIHTCFTHFDIADSPEITLEANPDDLSSEKLSDLFKYGINRLSIGIQSFDKDVLKFLNRVHNDEEAKN